MKNALIWFCRIAVGLLFIFSGLIKANDPLGFSYKLVEYFEVFHITFLNDLSLTIAILLCALEMILGFALLIGVRPVKVAWGLLLLIIFFGFLTFYSAFFKVVQTCGCFGDAIPLTPWQSFSKDMVLLVLVAVIFVNRRQIKPLFSAKVGDKWLIGAALVSVGFGLYTYNFLPVIDFLPYKIGANISAEMDTPPNAPKDVFVLTYKLKNKKTKETKVMTDKEYLSSGIWKDANWETDGDPENRLVTKGYEPPIRDLSIQDAQRNDFTKELLASPFYSIIIVAYDLDKTNDDAINKLNALAINATQNFNIRTMLLTANSPQSAQAFVKKHRMISEVFYADGVPLKTMIRSNPGVILLKNGIVVNKWHFHSVPKYDDLAKTYFQKQ
jgi:uncharacterized membrane protein YphA (DoxX/SURF4 family)